MDHINAPKALLQEVKENPLEWSLVALSLAMKYFSPSSTYIFVSEKKFRHDFHLGYEKAHRLLDVIFRGHRLFRLKPLSRERIAITARSLKKMYATHTTLKGGRESLEMTVVKVKCCTRENIYVTKIEKEMRQLLLLTNIADKTRADELKSKGLTLTGSAAHAAGKILSVIYLARTVARSSRTVIRMTKAASQQRLISIIRYPLVRICDDVVHTAMPYTPEGFIPIGFLGFVRKCNDYQLQSWDMRDRFKHILYAHRGRLTDNIVLRYGEVLSDTELRFLYD